MSIATFMATIKMVKSRSITYMQRKEEKWNHIKCSFETTKGIQKVKGKNRNKEGEH